MAFNYQEDEIECTIIESYGIFSRGVRFWNKEVNLVSWNGMPAKLDIRNWQRDHAKCGKGIAITREEAEELVKLLHEILRASPGAKPKASPRSKPGAKPASKPKAEKARARTQSAGRPGPRSSAESGAQKAEVPRTLEPFYKELKTAFGADPGTCKTARNALLKKYHPDISSGNIAYATRKTIKIKEAYERILTWWNEKKG